MNFSPEVIIVLQEQFTAVGTAMSISASAVREAVEACRRAEELEYRTTVAMHISAAISDRLEREEAELREIIAAIAEELREACDAENGDAARWGKVGQRYIGNDASDCRSVKPVEQKPSSYG